MPNAQLNHQCATAFRSPRGVERAGQGRGYQVAPAELEALLLRHPRIADAAVVPVADEEAGQRPKAIIVVKEPLSAEEVTMFVDERVAHYKRLAQVAFVDAIPKSPSGKILHRALVDRERSR